MGSDAQSKEVSRIISASRLARVISRTIEMPL
jgi:hypothetical protein